MPYGCALIVKCFRVELDTVGWQRSEHTKSLFGHWMVALF